MWDKIETVPKDQVVTYTCMGMDYCIQKKNKNQVQIQITVEAIEPYNLIKYPFELNKQTVDIMTSKIM